MLDSRVLCEAVGSDRIRRRHLDHRPIRDRLEYRDDLEVRGILDLPADREDLESSCRAHPVRRPLRAGLRDPEVRGDLEVRLHP